MQFSHQALLLCYLTVSQENSSYVKGEFVKGTHYPHSSLCLHMSFCRFWSTELPQWISYPCHPSAHGRFPNSPVRGWHATFTTTSWCQTIIFPQSAASQLCIFYRAPYQLQKITYVYILSREAVTSCKHVQLWCWFSIVHIPWPTYGYNQAKDGGPYSIDGQDRKQALDVFNMAVLLG
jgi:hypothetical protein